MIKNDEKLKDFINFIWEGDEVIVICFDWFGWLLKIIFEVIESIYKKGVCLNIIDGFFNIKNDNLFLMVMINFCGVFV